ncbi:MAG: hypothetical protein AAGG59_12220 [Bacteroidota bacterium]
MKKYGLVVALAAVATFCTAQGIDEERMERDIQIAQNILSTLENEAASSQIFVYGRDRFEGSYVEGYGVIFNTSHRYGRTIIADTKGTYKIYGDAAIGSFPEGSSSRGVNAFKLNLDSLTQSQHKEWVEKMKTFLVDYADLIGQLKPENKIMVTSGSGNKGDWFALEARASGTSTINEGPTVEISKKDLIDYKSGKINRNEALKRVKVISAASKEEVAQDVELLASIFERLYKSDLSNTYYLSGGVGYGKIPEFGVVFRMRVYSSSRNEGFHRIATRNQSGLSQDERDEIVKGMYPDFLKELKRNIIQYGRTVKSLEGNEMLMFKVRLTECKGCEIPKNLELSIKASDLKSYDSGKINESSAIAKLNVKEIGKQ